MFRKVLNLLFNPYRKELIPVMPAFSAPPESVEKVFLRDLCFFSNIDNDTHSICVCESCHDMSIDLLAQLSDFELLSSSPSESSFSCSLCGFHPSGLNS